MRHTDAVVGEGEADSQKLVGRHGRQICKPEETVIGEHSPQSHQHAYLHSFVGECRKRRVTVHDLDLLPQEDVAEYWNVAYHRRQDALIVEHFDGQVVHLQSIRHVSHALSVAIRVSYQNYFVPERQQTLRQVVDVLLDSAVVRKEKVGCYAASKSSVSSLFRENVHSYQMFMISFFCLLFFMQNRLFPAAVDFRARDRPIEIFSRALHATTKIF